MNQTVVTVVTHAATQGTTWIDTAKSVAPYLGLFVFGYVIYLAKLLMDRDRYAKMSKNQVLVGIQPRAGKKQWYTRPIDNIGGVSIIKIPDSKGKISESSAVHVLGEDGEYPVDFPINKNPFVQTTITGIDYYEGDCNPLSNITKRPIVSAQLLANILDGVASSTAEATRRSQEQSEGKKPGFNNPFLWVYIGVFATMGVAIAALVLIITNNKDIGESFIRTQELIRTALGIK